jgi:TonB-dependent receptor
VERTYNDLNGDDGTRASALFSTKFGDERMGILLGATYEDRPITEDSVYSNGDWRSDVTVPASWNLPDASNEFIYYMYDVRYQRKTESRKKSAVNAAFQWQPTDSLDINADVLYAEYDYDRSRGWFSAQMGHPRQNRISNPVITEHNHLVGGDVSNATVTTDHEGFQAPQNFITGGINATWILDSGMEIFAEVAHTKAERKHDQQNMGMTQTGNDFSFDLISADVPLINLANTDLDPLNYRVQGLYDRRTINEADENSFRLDVQYPMGGFFNKISAGVRVSAKRGVGIDPTNGRPVDWNTAEATSTLRAGIGTLPPSTLPWAMAALRPFNLSDVLPGTGLRLPPQMMVLDTHLIGNGGFGYSDAFYDAPFEKFPERTSTVEDTIGALYLRADFEAAGWQGNIGLRYARTETVIDNFALEAGGYAPFHREGSYSDLLPSLVVKKNLTEDMVFRFGVGETITRPPTGILGAVARINLVIDDPATPENEAESSTASLPNPDLEPQRGTNYDTSLEWYFADTSALALGLFYKSLDKQIDTGFKTSGTIDGYGDQVFLITTPTNIPGGWIRGFEVAYQQRFSFLPGLLANTGASINYTYLESETDDVDPRTDEKLPIRGMSENSINAQVYYEDERLSVRLLYNLRDDYYDRFDPLSRGTSIWTKGQPSLDAAIRYRFTDNFSLELQAVNLLDSPEEEFAGFEQYLNSYDLTGVRYSLGLSLKL